MQRETFRSCIAVSVVSGVLCGVAAAQPSNWVCGTTSGGKTICVRFDNRSTPPQLDQDFLRDLGDPPSVTLRQGEDGSGVFHWRIKCYDGSGPADIGAIAVDGSEDFELLIADENDDAGAADLNSCVLTPGGGKHSSLRAGSEIAGDLTGALKVVADSNDDGGTLNLTIAGDVGEDVSIEAEYVEALTIGDGVPADGTFAGYLLVHGGLRYDDAIEIGTLELPGVIDFDSQAILGLLSIVDGGSGELKAGSVEADAEPLPRVELGVKVTGRPDPQFSGRATFADLSGAGVVSYDLSGMLRFTGDVQGYIIIGKLSSGGRIAIEGSFLHYDVPSWYRDIAIWEELSADGAVTVDYSGWRSGHDWHADAFVQVGYEDPVYFYGNNPDDEDVHLFEVTECRGDLNNNGTVNTFDIEGFVAAISSIVDYTEIYPGLEASITYHGDMDCNGSFNEFDIDPFLGRIQDHCCECGGCGFRSGAPHGGLTAAQAGALFAENLNPALLDGFIAVLDGYVSHLDGDLATYWSGVKTYLEQNK